MYDIYTGFALYNFVRGLLFVSYGLFLHVFVISISLNYEIQVFKKHLYERVKDLEAKTEVIVQQSCVDVKHCLVTPAWVSDKLCLQTFTRLTKNSKAEQIESQWMWRTHCYTAKSIKVVPRQSQKAEAKREKYDGNDKF